MSKNRKRVTTIEHKRLAAQKAGRKNWQEWGPYLSERQWGTVREDYSPNGTAWDYLPHDHARSRAYRWGEDGIGGFSDDQQRLCMSVALWNGQDSILKERLFGLTNSEGNHGEDVKELYYYLDATPTHSYLKMLYKYPQRPFPYTTLLEENAIRDTESPEFELVDTGAFADNRYFDVTIEYVQIEPGDIVLQVTACNRGSESARLHVLPQICFRNTWSWNDDIERPIMRRADGAGIELRHPELGERYFYADGDPDFLFCDNDTNVQRLYGQNENGGFFKDGFHHRVVDGDIGAVNPLEQGTKAAAWYQMEIPAGGEVSVRVRMCPKTYQKPFTRCDAIFEKRRLEANAFYDDLQVEQTDADARAVQRQALAGMVWSKQFYYYDVPQWLDGDSAQPPPPPGRSRNAEWRHLNNADIISMPDKWEYPWYAAWDLAFHCVPLALIDPEFAKQQLVLLTREWYMHPSGQLPAYEWAFGDVNPPVHAWAALQVFDADYKRTGVRDVAFLERIMHKLMLNFTWWVNRKDTEGRNIFQGGFLGLDNIGIFDRSAPLPTGGYINQADGTSWMAMYCLNLMRMALELAQDNPVYEDIATKFFEHFLHIAEAMNNMGEQGVGLWDEEEQFFFDVLNMPNGKVVPLKVRSMVGLIPLFAVETLEPDLLKKVPEFCRRLTWFLNYRPDLAKLVSRWDEPGGGNRRLLALLRGHRMKCVLRRMLDETEFLSDFGVRALSRSHREDPYVFDGFGTRVSLEYQPAESSSGLFGGNSNWRGPIWFPLNFLIIESLKKFHHYYGDDFKIECPTGSNNFITIKEVAEELSRRLSRIFLRDKSGNRPVFGQYPEMQSDPNFADHLLFYEYFHGDTGRGVGASHQTGWTGLIAMLLQRSDQSSVDNPGKDKGRITNAQD